MTPFSRLVLLAGAAGVVALLGGGWPFSVQSYIQGSSGLLIGKASGRIAAAAAGIAKR